MRKVIIGIILIISAILTSYLIFPQVFYTALNLMHHIPELLLVTGVALINVLYPYLATFLILVLFSSGLLFIVHGCTNRSNS